MQIKQYPIIDLASQKPIEPETIQEDIVITAEPEHILETIDIAAIKQEAFISGKNEAVHELENKQVMHDQKVLAVMEALQEKFSNLESDLQQNKEMLINESIELSVAIAKKIINKSFENCGAELVKNFLSDQLPALYTENLITIKVAPDCVEAVKKYIQDIVYKKAHNLEVEILFDEAMIDGDCVIEVAGGKICRDKNKMLMQLDKLLNNYYSKDLYNKGYLSHSGNNIKN